MKALGILGSMFNMMLYRFWEEYFIIFVSKSPLPVAHLHKTATAAVCCAANRGRLHFTLIKQIGDTIYNFFSIQEKYNWRKLYPWPHSIYSALRFHVLFCRNHILFHKCSCSPKAEISSFTDDCWVTLCCMLSLSKPSSARL